MKKSEAKEITMIKVRKGTRAKLKAMKVSEREPYDNVIIKLLEYFKSKKKK